jgi:hypothetical protein
MAVSCMNYLFTIEYYALPPFSVLNTVQMLLPLSVVTILHCYFSFSPLSKDNDSYSFS